MKKFNLITIILAVTISLYISLQLRGLVESLNTIELEIRPVNFQLIDPPETVVIPQEVVNPTSPPGMWTTYSDLEMLARVLYDEARGIPGDLHKSAVVWCILNRYDLGAWGNTFSEVIQFPNAFAYSPSTPLDEDLLELVIEVVGIWEAEKFDVLTPGRTLPADYYYFLGDGKVNHYTQEWRGTNYWDWSL